MFECGGTLRNGEKFGGSHGCFYTWGSYQKHNPVVSVWYKIPSKVLEANKDYIEILLRKQEENGLGLGQFFTELQKEAALTTGLVTLDGEYTYTQRLAIMLPFRLAQEYPQSVADMRCLMSQGVDAIDAFYGAHAVFGHGGHHTAIYARDTRSDYRKYLERIADPANSTTYRSANSMWCGTSVEHAYEFRPEFTTREERIAWLVGRLA